MAEKERAQPAAGPLHVPPGIFAGAHEVPGRFLRHPGDMDRGEGTGPGEDGQLRRIAPVRFHAVPRTTGNQPGCDDRTGDPAGLQIPIELEAAGPREWPDQAGGGGASGFASEPDGVASSARRTRRNSSFDSNGFSSTSPLPFPDMSSLSV